MMKILCVFLFAFSAFASNLDEVKDALIKEFSIFYPRLIIEQVDLRAQNLPKDFNSYKFLNLAKTKLASSGFIRAEFLSPDNFSKNVFFRYFVKAKQEVLKSTQDIQRGEALSASNFTYAVLDFSKVPSNALFSSSNLIAKTNIKQNTILKENMFKNLSLVHKDDVIFGILKEDNIDLSIELVALEDGNKGDIIKAKNKEGKVLKGMIVQKNKIYLQ